jgi:hypothetical protein
MFGKKKKAKKKVQIKIKDYGSYFVFSKYQSNSTWHFDGEFDTPEEAESEMTMMGEPESIEYMIIKGQQLETEEGIATYPINIVRNNND